jgi:hypothetical protein
MSIDRRAELGCGLESRHSCNMLFMSHLHRKDALAPKCLELHDQTIRLVDIGWQTICVVWLDAVRLKDF